MYVLYSNTVRVKTSATAASRVVLRATRPAGCCLVLKSINQSIHLLFTTLSHTQPLTQNQSITPMFFYYLFFTKLMRNTLIFQLVVITSSSKNIE